MEKLIAILEMIGKILPLLKAIIDLIQDATAKKQAETKVAVWVAAMLADAFKA